MQRFKPSYGGKRYFLLLLCDSVSSMASLQMPQTYERVHFQEDNKRGCPCHPCHRKAVLLRVRSTAHRFCLLRPKDGASIGFFPTQGLPEDMAEVVKLYFSPKLRGHGMGYNMLKHIEQRARQTGYRRLYIESFPEFSKAVSLYEKFGFQHISHALGNSGHSAVTIWMTKNILQTSYTQLQTT